MKIHNIGFNKIRLTINQLLVHLLGLLILIGSLFVLGYLLLEYTIVCKEKQQNLARQCTLERSVLNLYHSSTNLGELKLASVVSGRARKGGTIYYVDLATNTGFVNLTGGSSSGRSDKDVAANAINNYINTGLENTFKVPYPTSWWIYALWAVFPLVGLGLLALRGVTIDFDRLLKTIVITRKGFFHTNEDKLLFSDVENIIIQESISSKGAQCYRLAFALKDKPPLPMVTMFDSSLAKKESIAKQLNEFIKEK